MKNLVSRYNTDIRNQGLLSFYFGAQIERRHLLNGEANDSFSEIRRARAFQTETHEFYFHAGDDVEIKLEFENPEGFDLHVHDPWGKRVLLRSEGKGRLRAVLPVYYTGGYIFTVACRGEADADYALTLKAF